MADAEEQRRAKARGEGLRAELLAKLRAGGPQTAGELMPQVKTPNVSLPEIAFQLGRLESEGQTVGSPGAEYRAL